MPVFQCHLVSAPKADPKALALTSPEATEAAHRFHRSLTGYAPTPLVSLPAQAARLGIGSLWVKDESHRFGLNAFKGLGGGATPSPRIYARNWASPWMNIPSPL